MYFEPPRFQLIEQSLHYRDICLTLKARPLTLRLVRLLLDNSSSPVSKDRMVDYIYGDDWPRQRSRRLENALHQNVTKLISRTRGLLNETFNAKGKRFDFLVYDPEKGTWVFVQAREVYFLEESQRIKLSTRAV